MPKQHPTQLSGAHARILVVDDESHIRAMLTRALTLSGFSVEQASSGVQALSLLESKLYDLMILDIQMPGLDGVEVMRKARGLAPELLVIVLTGHGSLESAIAAIKSDAVDYLLKPAGIQEIVDAVNRALESRSDQVRRHRLLRLVGEAAEELRKMSGPVSVSPPAEGQPFLSAGPFTLDRRKRVLTGPGDHLTGVDLSESEMAVMEAFIRRPNSVLSCHDLALMAWNYDVPEDEARNLLRQYIFRLRQKIEAQPGEPCWLRTVRGRGYLFSATDHASNC